MSLPDQPRAEREDVGVIMLARQLRRQRIVDQRAAAGGIAVDRDRDADAEPHSATPRSASPAAIASASLQPKSG